jgi:hypothetical protein
MSEEQSNFKVTDRRLFNPDGTPRDIEREEEEAREASTSTDAGAVSDTPTAQAASAVSSSPPPEAQSDMEAGGTETGSEAAPFDEASAGMQDEANIPGVDDPASFINFLMSIASNAAASLGMMEHPVTGERGVDLQLAKHWIDVLGMLQQKTRGNLAPQEQQIFEGLLSDLRMQFVSLTNTAPRTPRGFTGRDIIGGK